MNADNRDRFENGRTFSAPYFAYIIERSDVLNKDYGYFLEFWDIDRIARAGRLHDLYGKVRFAVDGWDDDGRELFAIPEVRAFLGDLGKKWPYFFYACDLSDSFLDRQIKCMVPTITAVQADSLPGQYRAAVKPSEVNQVCADLQNGLTYAATLDKQMNQAAYDARLQSLREYVNRELLG